MEEKAMKIPRSSLRIAAIIAFAIFIASCALPSIETERRALVIGISDYINLPPPSGPNTDLTYPSKDADDLKIALEASGWIVDNSLIDHAATKAAIHASITDFFAGLPASGTALIYFSGHGTDSSVSSYLVPSDYNGNPYSYSQMISPEELLSWITGSTLTKNVIFIADSCRSGGFVYSGDSHDVIASPYDSSEDQTIWVAPLPTIAGFAELLALNAKATKALDMIALSASGSSEDSYETSDLENGVFTQFLIEASSEGDKDHDGFVTCTEAYTYAARKVDSYWNDLYPTDYGFYPHISGGWRDLVLF